MSENSDIEDGENAEFLQPVKAQVHLGAASLASRNEGVIAPAAGDNPSEDLVSCVFTWGHGGHEVYLTGSFNDWSQRIKMVKTGHEFVTVLELKRSRHLYKFVVDEMWKFSPEQETASDEHGHVNNVLDITNHQRFCCWSASFEGSRQVVDESLFNRQIPESSDYTTDAPLIPFLLSKVVCPAGHPPPQLTAPLHGLANHIYHDSAVGSALGPKSSATSIIYRHSKQHHHKYLISIYATVSPMARHTLIPFCNPVHEFVQTHFHTAA